MRFYIQKWLYKNIFTKLDCKKLEIIMKSKKPTSIYIKVTLIKMF